MTHPREIYKHCPKCGFEKLHFNHPNAFFCKKCKFKFFVNAAAAVAAIIKDNKGCILLTRRKNEPAKGSWDIPGGFVNLLETAEEAVKREIKEELNLEIIETEYFLSVPNRYVFSELTVFTLDLAYICKVKNFKNILTDDDIDDYAFFEPEKIDLAVIGLSSIKKIIHHYVEKEKM